MNINQVPKATALSILLHYKEALERVCGSNKAAKFSVVAQLTANKGLQEVTSSEVKSLIEVLVRALNGFDESVGVGLTFKLIDVNSLEVQVEEETRKSYEASQQLQAGVQEGAKALQGAAAAKKLQAIKSNVKG